MSGSVARRPFGVTLVGVLIYINGFVDLIVGVLLIVLAAAGQVTQSVGGAWATGILLIVVGLIVLSVASGILRGSRTARTIIAIVEVVSIAANIYALVIGGQPAGTIVSIIFSLVILGLLYSGRASAFFARG